MSQRIMKYNPAFLSEDELVDLFCVRQAELELIVEVIAESTGPVNQHVLVVGPRGMGKTTLVRRAVIAVRRDKVLSERWFPLIFPEESYEVTTPGEFWLEALYHLAQQTKVPAWMRTYEELRDEKDEIRLRERALGQLLDFADDQGKRILLVVENLNMLLGDQLSDDDAWVIRHTMQNEPRVMFLASATSQHEEFENSKKAMFEQFRTFSLKPLNAQDSAIMWQGITGRAIDAHRIRPVQILTGGSPRLLTIISSFATSDSFEGLMQDLVQLVDDHTDYFKSHLDALPSTERKVYLALAEIWDPCTAREVATVARLDVSKTSALLNRLVERGAVTVVNEKPRRKTYQVAERLYNIYYLMRRRGEPSRRVKAIVNFMIVFYDDGQLINTTRGIFEEIFRLGSASSRGHFAACEAILENMSDETRRTIFDGMTSDKFAAINPPESLRQLAQNYVQHNSTATHERGHVAEPNSISCADTIRAEKFKAIKKTIDRLEESIWNKSTPMKEDFARLNVTLDDYLHYAHDDWVTIQRGSLLLLGANVAKHLGTAERGMKKVIEIYPENRFIRYFLSVLLCFNRQSQEAIDVCEILFKDPSKDTINIELATCLMAALYSAGVGREALALAQDSPRAANLEPLIVALQMLLGDEIKAAVEIVEVAKDVAEKIERMKVDWLKVWKSPIGNGALLNGSVKFFGS